MLEGSKGMSMPEIPHAMTYGLLPDATSAVPVYQCCGKWCYLAPQAMFHLWHTHGFTAEAAWAQIDGVRGAPAPAQRAGSNAAPPIQAQPLPPTPASWSSSQSQSPDIARDKQGIIDASLASFRAKIVQR